MPANRYRSRSYKRVYKNTPGGENVLRYKKKMPARIRHFLFYYEINKLAKSHKRPNRPYGGYLCSSCARKHFKNEARK